MKLSNIFNRRNRILLAELVRTDFKLRYQASALGYLWSILNPLLLFTILYVVFDRFLGIGRGIEHFAVYLLLGIVLWRFFVEATNNGLKAIVARGSLIRKINFPRYIIVISGTISSLINLLINLVVVFIFILINGVDLSWQALLIIPLVIELYLFALAIAFFLAAVNVKFRDISYLWDVFIQAAFYATPIIYPLTLVLAQSQFAAQLLVTDDSLTMWELFKEYPIFVLVPFVIIILIGSIAAVYFKKSAKRFAEFV
jgi:ABC-2 type transport system permease protein